MTSSTLIKVFFLSFMSLIFAYTVFSRYDHEVGSELSEEGQRYLPYIPGQLLPAVVLVIVGLSLYVKGVPYTIQTIITMYFNLFIHISLFYMVLILLLPTLRKHISARAISFLWMLPNYLYLIFYRFMVPEKPLFVIELPTQIIHILLGIIFIGTFVIFFYEIFSHLKYRHHILKDSKEVTDINVLNICKEELDKAGMKKLKIKLVESKNVSTPLTIGLFKKTTKVVLPHLNYNSEDLRMIFRHEIVHIGREDVWSKFFLIFCLALCWYNPLMWIAKRKCSEDIELSCDETVLMDLDESQRKQYAYLILDTAASNQGFTTCLSSSKEALQYRLKNIVREKKKHTGAITVGLAFFVMAMSCGFISLAYNKQLGSEAIFKNQDPNTFNISHITIYDNPYNQEIECVDKEGFHQFLSNLEMSPLTGDYTFESEDELRYTLIYDDFGLVISEDAIKVVPFNTKNQSAYYYYLLEPLNWDEFHQYIKTYPAMKMLIKYENDKYFDHVNGLLCKVTKDNQTIYGEIEVSDDMTGIYGSRLPVIGKLDFSETNIKDFHIDVYTWDRQHQYTISKEDINEDGEFNLPNYSAHYEVFVTFEDGTEAKFLVNIALMEEYRNEEDNIQKH